RFLALWRPPDRTKLRRICDRVWFTFGKSTNSGFYLFLADGPIRLGDSDVFLGICYRGSGVEIGWLRRSDQRACDDSNETTCHPCDTWEIRDQMGVWECRGTRARK